MGVTEAYWGDMGGTGDDMGYAWMTWEVLWVTWVVLIAQTRRDYRGTIEGL